MRNVWKLAEDVVEGSLGTFKHLETFSGLVSAGK